MMRIYYHHICKYVTLWFLSDVFITVTGNQANYGWKRVWDGFDQRYKGQLFRLSEGIVK